jgi:hypothetical protein
MAKNKAKINSNMEIVLQLLQEDDVSSEMGEAFSSYLLNPTVVWAKFILTDDRKNANGQRVPRSEFPNLIKSGIHMPVKMALGEIREGHDESKPLGVITHLKEIQTNEGASAIVALAALWGQERPEDVQYIKEKFSDGQAVNVSWEILYSNSVFNTETDSIDLQDTTLRAATVVGTPAYKGRTQFLSVAAKKWSPAYLEELPDSSFMYIDENGERYFPIMDKDGTIDRTKLKDTLNDLSVSNLPQEIIKERTEVLNELINNFNSKPIVDSKNKEEFPTEKNTLEEVTLDTTTIELQAEVERLTALLAEQTAALDASNAILAQRDAEKVQLIEQGTTQESELASLREFKASVDAQTEKAQKLESVKARFVEAGIIKSDEYYLENSEKLSSLDSGALDFMIQELTAFVSESSQATASKKTKIPAILGNSESTTSREELVEYLKNRNVK